MLAEFVGAAVLGLALGVFFLQRGSATPVAAACAGIGLNYVPLSIHAVRFSARGRLDAELTSVEDPTAELRAYSLPTPLRFIPFLVLLLAIPPNDWSRHHR